MTRRPPRSPLFPYPPLFRSERRERVAAARSLGEDVAEAGADRGDDDPRERDDAERADEAVLEEPPAEKREHDQFEPNDDRSEEHTSELQSQSNHVCRLLLEN